MKVLVSLLWVCVAVADGGDHATKSDDMLLDEIFAAWNGREKGVATCRVQWETVTTTVPPGGDPSRPVEQKSVDEFWFGEGTRRRFESTGNQVSMSGKLIDRREKFSDNGEGAWRELLPPTSDRDYPVGLIQDQRWGRRDLFPVMLCFGKMPANFAIERKRWRVMDRDVPLGSSSGVLLEEVEPFKPRERRRLVIDPALDHCPVRYTVLLREGRVRFEFEIRYRMDDSGTRLPGDWTYTAFEEDGSVFETKQSSVTDYELNPKLDPSTFLLEFPERTFVQDGVGKRAYLQLGQGRIRVLTESESSLPYPKLLELTKLDGGSGGGTFFWIAVANTAVLAVLVVVAWLRRSGKKVKVVE